MRLEQLNHTNSTSAPVMWTTSLSETTAETIAIRGYNLTELIGTVSFPAVVHLLYTGELPDPGTARLIDAVMVASIDHGAGAPSVLAARTAISGGATLQAAAAAGLLTLGEYHGAAVESSMHPSPPWSTARARKPTIHSPTSPMNSWLTGEPSTGEYRDSGTVSTSAATPDSTDSCRLPVRPRLRATTWPQRSHSKLR